MNPEWTLLETFGSEVEARVVESFLNAQGLEVQLLDTHMMGSNPGRGLGGITGLRLLVRTTDVERARQLILASRKGSHLEIVGEQIPAIGNPYEKWMIMAVLLAAAITYCLTR